MKHFLKTKLAGITLLLALFTSGCAAMQAQQAIRDYMVAESKVEEAIHVAGMRAKALCEPSLKDSVDAQYKLWPLFIYMKTGATLEQALVALNDFILPAAAGDGSACALRVDVERVGSLLQYKLAWGVPYILILRIVDEELKQRQVTFNDISTNRALLWATLNGLYQRADRGELTALQFIRAVNAARSYMIQQETRYRNILRQNLAVAQAQDQAVLQGIATGLAVVATAALVVNTYENYRIANAEGRIASAQELQAVQNQTPFNCVVTSGWSTEHISCR